MEGGIVFETRERGLHAWDSEYKINDDDDDELMTIYLGRIQRSVLFYEKMLLFQLHGKRHCFIIVTL